MKKSKIAKVTTNMLEGVLRGFDLKKEGRNNLYGKKNPLFCDNCVQGDRNNKHCTNQTFLEWLVFSQVEEISSGFSKENPLRFPIGKGREVSWNFICFVRN